MIIAGSGHRRDDEEHTQRRYNEENSASTVHTRHRRSVAEPRLAADDILRDSDNRRSCFLKKATAKRAHTRRGVNMQSAARGITKRLHPATGTSGGSSSSSGGIVDCAVAMETKPHCAVIIFRSFVVAAAVAAVQDHLSPVSPSVAASEPVHSRVRDHFAFLYALRADSNNCFPWSVRTRSSHTQTAAPTVSII
jgi:hypothetical protein